MSFSVCFFLGHTINEINEVRQAFGRARVACLKEFWWTLVHFSGSRYLRQRILGTLVVAGRWNLAALGSGQSTLIPQIWWSSVRIRMSVSHTLHWIYGIVYKFPSPIYATNIGCHVKSLNLDKTNEVIGVTLSYTIMLGDILHANFCFSYLNTSKLFYNRCLDIVLQTRFKYKWTM